MRPAFFSRGFSNTAVREMNERADSRKRKISTEETVTEKQHLQSSFESGSWGHFDFRRTPKAMITNM